jgi:hypothetical protein
MGFSDRPETIPTSANIVATQYIHQLLEVIVDRNSVDNSHSTICIGVPIMIKSLACVVRQWRMRRE